MVRRIHLSIVAESIVAPTARRALAAFLLGALFTTPGPAGLVHADPGTVTEEEEFDRELRAFDDILRLVRENYVEEVPPHDLVGGAIEGLLRRLDPHSNFVDAKHYEQLNERNRGEYGGIGISFALRAGFLTVIAPLEDSPCDRLGIRAGDRIVKIDGESAVGLSEQGVFERLRGADGTTVRLAIQRPGAPDLLEFAVTRERIPIKSVPYGFLLDRETGYVRIIRFSATTGAELASTLIELEAAGMKRLVLDLRSNPGGYLEQAVAVAEQFIAPGQMVVYTHGRTRGSSEEHYAGGGPGGARRVMPLIVLVNHGSASAAEIVAGAVQDWDRGLVLGQTTFGKGLVQRQYRLRDGSAVFLTVGRYFTPSGRLIQRPYAQDKLRYYAEGYDDKDPNAEGGAIDGAMMGGAAAREVEARGPVAAGAATRMATAGVPAGNAAPGSAEDRGGAASGAAATVPIHHTASGRVVRGGGGITPDFWIDPEDRSELAEAIERSDLLFDFATDYVGRVGFVYPQGFEHFLQRDGLDEKTWKALLDFAARERPDLPRAELIPEKPFLARGVKREIAGILWGPTERYRVHIGDDRQVAESRRFFGQAADLVRRASESAAGPAWRSPLAREPVGSR
jgi:carboxyl-terminal processing protease